MKASRAEIKICEILDSAGINFTEEYSFPDLLSTSKHPLRFDFCVFDDEGEEPENIEFLIEYQGEQHFIAKSKFGGMPGLKKQQYNDMLKRDYCKKNGYKLILIPYWDENLVNYDYIMNAAYGENW